MLATDSDFRGAQAIPRRLAAPLRKALSHAADERHSTLAALLAALRRADDRRPGWIAGGAAMTTAAVAIGWLAWQSAASPVAARQAAPSERTVVPPVTPQTTTRTIEPPVAPTRTPTEITSMPATNVTTSADGEAAAQRTTSPGQATASSLADLPQVELDAPAADPPAVPPPAAVREASLAYLATMRAYNRADAEAYFTGFMAPMPCFYSVPDADVRARRKKLVGYIEVSERDLELVATNGADEVTFCERGTYDYERGRGRTRHNKAIVMRKVDGAWKIAVETTGKHPECFVFAVHPGYPLRSA